jgi:hypothetical protein
MLQSILHQLSIWIVVIPFLIGIMNFNGLNLDSRWIFFLTMAALIPQLMTAFVENDGPLFDATYNLYTPLEFAVLFVIFSGKFISTTDRWIIWSTAALYLLVCASFFIRFGIINKFLGGLVCVNNIIYMFWILLLLKQEYSLDTQLIRKSNAFTWYFIAWIFYAPCTVALFALYHYIRDPGNVALKSLTIIQDIFNILLYLLLSVGLLIRKTH